LSCEIDFAKSLLNGVTAMNDQTILVFKNQRKVQKSQRKIIQNLSHQLF